MQHKALTGWYVVRRSPALYKRTLNQLQRFKKVWSHSGQPTVRRRRRRVRRPGRLLAQVRHLPLDICYAQTTCLCVCLQINS